MKRVGICFSKDFLGADPLGHIGEKLPVYIRLLEMCQKEGWEVYVLTRKTYRGAGIFDGAWLFKNDEFKKKEGAIEIDLVYDRTGGIKFPPAGDNLNVINVRDFKILCWNKWLAYKEIGRYMPKTFWVGKNVKDLEQILVKIKTQVVVLKPYNGLKGMGVYIGPKKNALNFNFSKKKYIAQEFVDTSGGIPRVVEGLHDLRVAIVNGKAVWCHVRTPMKGSLKANVAEGGTLTEVAYNKVPLYIKDIVEDVANKFYKKYDNPCYSIDFGIENGKPFVFEINDAIGFPKWGAKGRDKFLEEMVSSFKSKLIKV